jgi:hypothetical protein
MYITFLGPSDCLRRHRLSIGARAVMIAGRKTRSGNEVRDFL